jgi:hypothetical protein
MKYILLGCGLLTGLFILGIGSCAGVMSIVYKSTEPVAEVGADYLRNTPELQSPFGTPVIVKRRLLDWNVNIVNEGGNARITYDVRGPGIPVPAEAVVWLLRSGGRWSATGARVVTKDHRMFTAGQPPPEHTRFQWNE